MGRATGPTLCGLVAATIYKGGRLVRDSCSDGMPYLDEHGIHDVESSQRTKKLVTGRGSLRLRSVSPQEEDDDMSTEESDVDPRCMELNDPTVRIRT